MIFGYGRALPSDKNCAEQKKALQEMHIQSDRLYLDSSLTASSKRTLLMKILDEGRRGDEVIVLYLGSLGDSVESVVSIVEQLIQKQMHLRIIEDDLSTKKDKTDLIVAVFLAFSKLIKSIRRKNRAEGIATTKSKGRSLGRPKRLTPKQLQQILDMLNEGETIAHTAKQFNVSERTISRIKRSEM